MLKWPGGPQGVKCEKMVESVDLYPTLCELCDVPLPSEREGISLIKIASGKQTRNEVYCEWESFDEIPAKLSSVRTEDFRLVFYAGHNAGELYDLRKDQGEIHNLWNHPDFQQIKMDLLQRLLDFTLKYKDETGVASDRKLGIENRNAPTSLVHKHRVYWSDLEKAYQTPGTWPPKITKSRRYRI